MTTLEVVQGEVVEYGSLSENEEIIKRGMTSFVEVGRALARIRDDGQYVTAGFDTFEEYCQQRWDLGSNHARQYIRSVDVIDALTDTRVSVLPASEFTTRPLVKVLNDHGEDAVREVWSRIVVGHEGEGPITGREVARFVKGGNGANYGGKPGWHEMLGEVGDTLIRADKQLTKVEAAISRTPNKEFRVKAGKYALWACDLATRLREIEGTD